MEDVAQMPICLLGRALRPKHFFPWQDGFTSLRCRLEVGVTGNLHVGNAPPLKRHILACEAVVDRQAAGNIRLLVMLLEVPNYLVGILNELRIPDADEQLQHPHLQLGTEADMAVS